MRLLQAELLKIRTAPRTTLGLVLGLFALVGVGALATAGEASGTSLDAGVTWDVIGVASIASVFTLIFGILVVTWEYRHGTITQTFLASPRREYVVAAKLAIALVTGAVLAAAAIAFALLLAEFRISVDIPREAWERIGGLVLGAALWGVLGAGLGALLQTQVGAIVTAFVWFLVAEPLIGFQFDSFPDYLPGHVIDRLQQASGGAEVTAQGIATDAAYPYGAWTAALLAIAYAAGFAALGLVSVMRRDVS